ncbi:MAG TPA: MaoC/PaaZ C-terminal domain-containing protein [Rhizomicrobium sp.]|jgi:acyl dehydratase
MAAISKSVAVGDTLPDHVQGGISRTTLALFAGASNDYVRLHIDSDYVKEAGLPDVFAHGMLSMAYMGQLLTNWMPQDRLRYWNVRFLAITPLHATVTCRGEVTEVFEEGGEQRARLKLSVSTQDGVSTLDGEAVVAI